MAITNRPFLAGWSMYGKAIDQMVKFNEASTNSAGLKAGVGSTAGASTTVMGAPVPGNVSHMSRMMMMAEEKIALKDELKEVLKYLQRPEPPELKNANVQQIKMMLQEAQKAKQEYENKVKLTMRSEAKPKN